MPRGRAWRAAACVSLLPAVAIAQNPAPQAAAVQALRPVVVTATRTDALAFDVPASIDSIDGEELREGRAQVNLSESLGAVPGLLARDRQNYAQDVQISVRGFGARSTFGIRGVRLYVDGIPATLPDGQGQISHVELGSVGRIEVLRGPFSALYGNSSGGVVSVFTEEGSGAPRLRLGALGGSDGTLRLGVQASGNSGANDSGVGYVVSASRFRTDGFRDHSATERTLGNAKLTLRPGADSQLTLVANSVSVPMAQDPLGLSRAQLTANPRGVDPSAQAFDTRKTIAQTQGGVVYARRIDAAHTLQLTGYLGQRETSQFQSIPVATQANVLHPGGVIALGRDYRGADLRWTWKTTLRDAPLTLVTGLAYDSLAEQRQGYQNFAGTTLGVQGALRRDERNDVANFDQYVQAQWQVAPRWTVNAGLRHSRVRFASRDAYVTATNPDDSGSARYGATLPVLGLLFALTPATHLYASAGKGFETPTLNELSYRADGASGLNFGLQAAGSQSVELGVKTRAGVAGELTAAVFRTGTDHEIVTQTSVGGRSTFQNAGRTQRTGFELGWSGYFLQHLRTRVAYTALQATYRDGFTTCSATPCAVPTQTIAAGNRIPGTARAALFAGAYWMPPTGWRGGVEIRSVSRMFVNDLNSDAAAGYAVASAYAGYVARLGRWTLEGFVRADNLADRRVVGSVIVNEGNSRFLEPGPGRTWVAGASATLQF